MTAVQDVQTLLREYGGAIRGDWSDLDGRSVRANLDDLADLLDQRDVDVTLERIRLGLCEFGGGHWDRWCDDECSGALGGAR